MLECTKVMLFFLEDFASAIAISAPLGALWPFLEDHPMTCKWLITMVSTVSPLNGVIPLINGLNGL